MALQETSPCATTDEFSTVNRTLVAQCRADRENFAANGPSIIFKAAIEVAHSQWGTQIEHASA